MQSQTMRILMVFRLTVFLLLLSLSFHAHALTFKSGEPISKSSEVSWDILSKQVGEFTIDFEAETIFDPKSNWQHYQFRDFIASSFRNLVVPNDFTLIDDYDRFMSFHYDIYKNQVPDSTGEIERFSKGIDINKCVQDLGSTLSVTSITGTKITVAPNAPPKVMGIGGMSNACSLMLQQRFLHDPKSGINNYKEIHKAWLKNGRLAHVNEVMRKLPKTVERLGAYAYNAQSVTARLISHYTFYHRDYHYDKETHHKIVAMMEQFYLKLNLYESYSKIGTLQSKICDLKSTFKLVRGTNDYCGSIAFRMAVSAILFGLEFENQKIFDAGIRYLEIKLATFNRDAIYAAHAQRGCAALGYSQNMVGMLETLQFAFQKAFNIDFMNVKNMHGVTPLDVYKRQWELAHDPVILEKYVQGEGLGTCGNWDRSFKEAIKAVKKNKGSYKVFWNGWRKHNHILDAPSLAMNAFPKKFELYNNMLTLNRLRRDVAKGADHLSIETYFLRVATGFIELSDYRVAREKHEREERLKDVRTKEDNRLAAEQARLEEEQRKDQERLAAIRAEESNKHLDAIKGSYSVELTQEKGGRILNWGRVKIVVDGDALEISSSFPDETQPHLKSLNPKFDDTAILLLNGKWRMAPAGYQCMVFSIDLLNETETINQCDATGHKTKLSFRRIQ